MKEKVTLAIVGAGSRGMDSYAPHAKESPYNVEFVAVAEPRKEWREKAVSELNIPKGNIFSCWKELAEQPRLADGVLITTQDSMHVEPAIALMKKGYHVMLEKPMATTESDCRAIIAAQQETKRMLAVCHVMRYSKYSKTVKRLLEDGVVGDIMSIQHIEPIGYWHIAHSYVRGNWRKESDSCPMLLAKSCHDLDILRYWIGQKCLRVSSFGNLTHFAKKNQPEGAADRCLDCPSGIESQCPYSACKIYLRDRAGGMGWPNNILTNDTSIEGVTKALRVGPYGRCIYACDNNVVDHQVVNLEFDGGATVAFTMCGFTASGVRETWIMGTKGQIKGDMNKIIHFDFLTEKEVIIPIDETGDAEVATGHAGDSTIVLNFIAAIAEDNPALISTTPEASLESHLIAFAAERARQNNSVEELFI